MQEEEGTSSYSMTISQQPKLQQPHQPILKWYWVAITLVLLGFYFLIFATIELVTNYGQHNVQIQLNCDLYQCRGVLDGMNFPDKSIVYMYLYNNQFTQNIIEGVNVCQDTEITNCNYLSTNAQMQKNASVIGKSLQPNDLAYPCGPIALYYPDFQLTVLKTDTKQNVTVNTGQLSVTEYTFKNQDFSKQWTDVETSRYSVWSQIQIGIGIYKYWGYIQNGLSGDYQITFQTNNPLQSSLTTGLSIELTNNQAFNGHNVSLCTFNFFWAFSMFFLGCFSFYVISIENSSIKKIKPQIQKQSLPQFSSLSNQ